eukprot:TRINITY_DN19086_c0_g1_i1.p1 TRINITY_DN19086_c0_g1~~TRINITY_DN19086_c0_g1_i1.p1  ORF type:complete len:304 (-),score=42.72 TRINITY_DN19086_c0_g1_i1:116-979(-)
MEGSGSGSALEGGGSSGGYNGEANSEDDDDDDDDDDDGPSGLVSLPTNIGQMAGLRRLVLRANVSISSLPASFWSLSALESLVLDFTETRFHTVPMPPAAASTTQASMGFGSLDFGEGGADMGSVDGALAVGDGGAGAGAGGGELARIGASGSDTPKPAGIRELPERIGQLSRLQRLDLIGCTELEDLPESLGSLKLLQRLVVAFCPKLRALPAGIGRLPCLQTLVVQQCPALVGLPLSLAALAGLPELCIDEKSIGGAIPDGLMRVPGLRRDALFFEESLFDDMLA